MPTVTRTAVASPVVTVPDVVWLDVDYPDRDKAKAAGARWNPTVRRWSIRSDADLTAVAAWLPAPSFDWAGDGPWIDTVIYVDIIVCWRCHQTSPVILGCHHPLTQAPHGATSSFLDVLTGPRYERLRADIGLGPIKKRYSRAARGSYLSQGCGHCDALFGSFHLDEQLTEAHADGVLDTLRWPTPIRIPAAAFTIEDDIFHDNDDDDDDDDVYDSDDAVAVV